MYFSVVIPLYNKQKHILRAVQSVLSQTYDKFELLVIDDGSTDDSYNLVCQVDDPRIKVIRQANGGEAVARNRGILESRYEYIAFLDADDKWEIEFLHEIRNLINEFPKMGLYCTYRTLVDPVGNKVLPKIFLSKETSSLRIDDYFAVVSKGSLLATSSSSCVPKCVFDDVGVFPVGDKLGADQDMWNRIMVKYSLAFSWFRGAIYFQDAENRVCNLYIENDFPNFVYRLMEYLENNKGTVSYNDISKYIALKMFESIFKNIVHGNKRVAYRLLRNGFTNILISKKIVAYLCILFPPLLLRTLVNLRNARRS